MNQIKINVGDTVRVRGVQSRKHTTVIRFIKEVKGGVVLEHQIDGFRCWNVKDLKLVKRKTR